MSRFPRGLPPLRTERPCEPGPPDDSGGDDRGDNSNRDSHGSPGHSSRRLDSRRVLVTGPAAADPELSRFFTRSASGSERAPTSSDLIAELEGLLDDSLPHHGGEEKVPPTPPAPTPAPGGETFPEARGFKSPDLKTMDANLGIDLQNLLDVIAEVAGPASLEKITTVRAPPSTPLTTNPARSMSGTSTFGVPTHWDSVKELDALLDEIAAT